MLKTFFFLSFLVTVSVAKEPMPKAVLKGVIVDTNETVIERVKLRVQNATYSRNLMLPGRFTLDGVPFGSYRVSVAAKGFLQKEWSLEIAEETIEIKQILEPETLRLRDAVVATSSHSVFDASTQSGGAMLDQEAIENLPHFGDDILRVMETLPGTSSNDFGSAFRTRNSLSRETSMILDGLELTNPYHLKDFGGVFSFLDPEIMGRLELSTGGYSARYGNAMSGVLNLQSRDPIESRSTANVTFGTVGIQTEGTFAEGLGSYLVSARRGYIDLLLKLGGEDEEGEQDIVYFDSFGKIAWTLGDSHRWSASYLLGQDDFVEQEVEENEVEDSNSFYDDLYLWTNLTSVWGTATTSSLTFFWSRQKQDRDTSTEGDEETYDILDYRENKVYGINAQLETELGRNWYIQTGVQYRENSADFDYDATFENLPDWDGPQGTNWAWLGSRQGHEWGAFVTGRVNLGPKLIGELGLRYDDQEWNTSTQLSPRFNLAWSPDRQHAFKIGLGRFTQAERPMELQVADGITYLSEAETSDQLSLGYEYSSPSGGSLRLDGYYRKIDDVRIRFANLTRSMVRFPGLSYDRVMLNPDESKSYGLELTWSQQLGTKWDWFFHYAWGRYNHEFEAQTLRDPFEQEHTVKCGLNWVLGAKWTMNVNWNYHTGWRTTALSIQEQPETGVHMVAPAEPFAETFPAYHRMDLRISRNVIFSSRREFRLFVDIFNCYNRKNIRGYEAIGLVETSGVPRIEVEEETWLPILPTVGATWRF